MKKNKIYYMIAFFIPLVMGCKKALDLNPINNISDATYWQTGADFKLWANGFYGYLKTPAGDWVSPNIFDDANSDIAGGLNNSLSNGTLTTPAQSSLWNNSYANIRNINILLEHAATYTGADNVKQYVAEAHFFRAYEYTNLLMSYGDVPLVTKTLDVNSPELFDARASRDAVVDYIVSELNAAVPDLPLESAIANADKGRISKGAAQGLLARIGLFEGTWQKSRGNTTRATSLLNIALTASNSVITSSQYKLWSPANGIALGDSTYYYLFVLENDKSNPLSLGKSSNNEFILAHKYDGNYARLNVNIALAGAGSVTRTMMDTYLCSDGLPVTKSPLFQGYGTQQSEFANRDPRLKNTVGIPGNIYYNYANPRFPTPVSNPTPYYPALQNATLYANRKFATERALTDANFSGFDYPIIRYAEILLINAETKFELNNAISDVDLNLTINQLRDRVGMIHLTNALVGANGLDMRTEIRRERTIELAYEGFRLTDLYRWKTAEVQMPKEIAGVPVAPYLNPSSTPNIKYPFLTRPATDANGFYVLEPAGSRHFDATKNYLLPLPSQQIQQNPKIIQNPGW